MKRLLVILGLLALTLNFPACGGGSSSSGGGQGNTASQPVFITGEDAPLPSVVDFNITLNSITLDNSSGSVTLLSSPTTVDFGRLVGLRSLLGFNKVAPGTYTSATFTMASPVIDFVNLTTNPPTLSTLNGTLTQSTVTVAFPNAMVVSSNGLAGLHMDFDLRDSLQTDQTGQITGTVTPVITIKAVSASDADGQITDFTGSLVSSNIAGNSFLMQGPWGFQEVIDVNSQTQFNGSFSLASLPMGGIISVAGTVQSDGSIMASVVEVVTTDQAFISGRLLQVNPASGPAQTVTLFIGEELPVMSGNFARGQVVTLNVNQITTYEICFIDNAATGLIFNSGTMVAGQRIFLGGVWDSSTATFTPDLISLRRQGVIGLLSPGSVSVNSGNQGSFQLQNNGLLEWVAQGPFTVNTGNLTAFLNINGLAGLSSAGTAPIVASGLVLKDLSGEPEVFAGTVAILP